MKSFNTSNTVLGHMLKNTNLTQLVGFLQDRSKARTASFGGKGEYYAFKVGKGSVYFYPNTLGGLELSPTGDEALNLLKVFLGGNTHVNSALGDSAPLWVFGPTDNQVRFVSGNHYTVVPV